MNKELLEKVKTPEEVVALAKQHGKELTLEKAKELLDKVKNAVSGELSDDILDAVAGGRDFLDDWADAADDMYGWIP